MEEQKERREKKHIKDYTLENVRQEREKLSRNRAEEAIKNKIKPENNTRH